MNKNRNVSPCSFLGSSVFLRVINDIFGELRQRLEFSFPYSFCFKNNSTLQKSVAPLNHHAMEAVPKILLERSRLL